MNYLQIFDLDCCSQLPKRTIITNHTHAMYSACSIVWISKTIDIQYPHRYFERRIDDVSIGDHLVCINNNGHQYIDTILNIETATPLPPPVEIRLDWY